jgi:hypothetical protein
MKKNIFKILLLLVLLSPVMMLTSCEEDAPTYTYSAEDLEGAWKWESDVDYFQVEINPVDDSKFEIKNFQKLGDMTCTVTSKTTFTFSGELRSHTIKDGKGTITNSYQSIILTYTIIDPDEESEEMVVNLNKGKAISK